MDRKRTTIFITKLENALGKIKIDADDILTIGETIKLKDFIMLFSSVQTQGVYFVRFIKKKELFHGLLEPFVNLLTRGKISCTR